MFLENYLKNFQPPKVTEKSGCLNCTCTTLLNGNLRFNFQGNFNDQFICASKVYQHFSNAGFRVNIKPQNQNWLVVYININDEKVKNEI